jgi:Initiator Replication protein
VGEQKKTRFGSKISRMSDAFLRVQERTAKAAGLDVIKSFYRLVPLERAVVEAVLSELVGTRLLMRVDFKKASPLLAEALDKQRPQAKGRRPAEMTLAQEALSRLSYYHRPVFRDEANNRTIEWHTHWLSGYAELGEGVILVSIEEKIVPHLKVLKAFLSRRSFGARFTSQYSVRLYEWAWPYRNAGLVRVSMEELRTILGVNEERDEKGRLIRAAILKHWPNLKQRALSRALSEISTKSDLEIRLTASYRGEMRKVAALVFEIKQKEAGAEGEGS